MKKELKGKKPHFRDPKPRSNYYLILILLTLIMIGIWYVINLYRGNFEQPFSPTPTATKSAESYILEARAYVDAGKLDDPSNNIPGSGLPPINDAIEAFQKALDLDPDNAAIWSELARIQAYSSPLLRNDLERRDRLVEALNSADKAIELAPDDSGIRAVRAFVLDWYAFNPLLTDEEREEFLQKANVEASRAFQLDPNNALALAYYAEILVDQMKWMQAENYASTAVKQAPHLMDTHRVYGYVLESIGQYNNAIKEYQKAVEINPNFTFLYIRIGQNYREGIHNPDKALEYFSRAAAINDQLGIENPIPFIEIAKTYSQEGQFFAASLNAEKAVLIDPTNAHIYGQLGLNFIRARNYEGAVPLLKCAVRSCQTEENELGGVAVEGLPLTSRSVAYYYVEYGTVLAFLSRPNENFCPEAVEVLNEVGLKYPDDPILMSIVNDSKGICNKLEKGQ